MMNVRWESNEESVEEVTARVATWEPWLNKVANQHALRLGDLGVVLHNDESLNVLNEQYLNHEDWTDIITFNQNTPGHIHGELHISWERVQENAAGLGVAVWEELKRVVVHGVLHLMGYNDKTEVEQRQMRALEDASLQMFHVEHGNER